MTRFALRGLLGRKLRTALTAIAIVLGVAMVAGTFVLTDSIDKAFDSIFTDSRQGSNAVVTGKAGASGQPGSRKLPYGSLCVERERLARIGAYDEELEVWGGDDDNTRVRLDLDGTAIAMCDDMQMLHLADKPRIPPHVRRGIDQLLPIWRPARAAANPRGWGQTFQRVALTWRAKP